VVGVNDRHVEEFWRLHEDGTELRPLLEEFAPPPPQGLNVEDDAVAERWVASSFTAALIALDQAPEDPAIRSQLAWTTARVLFNDPETFPL
jgi:hypothetical protein